MRVTSESNNLNFTDLYLSAESNDPEKPPHNTDGFDLTNCDTMYMANIEIHNQDDCIAYKNGKPFMIKDEMVMIRLLMTTLNGCM